MLNQILVLSPAGPCFVHRKYRETKNQMDPQLLSAMVALGAAGNMKPSEIIKILRQEANNYQSLSLDISRSYNYISCALSSKYMKDKRIKEILPRINQLTYETLGSPNDMISVDSKKIEKVENRIDLIMMKEGIISG